MQPANYNSPTTPLPNNFRRISGSAYFTPDNDAISGDISLGSVLMTSLKHNQAEVEVMAAYKGGLLRVDDSVSEIKPEWDLTLNEYMPNLIPIYLFGDRGPDFNQAASVAATATFIGVAAGRSYRIGKRMISAVSVAVGAAAKTENIDYQVDLEKGYITIMDGGSIAAGATVTVTFSAAALTLPTYMPYSRLNRRGFMRIYEEDVQDRNPRSEFYFYCNLIPTDPGDGDPKKYSEAKLKVIVLGKVAMYGR